VTKILTDAAVRKFKPTAKRRRIRDAASRSLFLIIEQSGRKSFAMRFRRPDGRPGKITLGPFDASGRELAGEPQIGMPLSLAAARQLAAEVHRQRALGRDPIADNKARRHRQHAEIDERAAGAFGVCVRKFVDEHCRVKTRRWRETARNLGFVYPLDGGEPTEARGGLVQRWGERDVRTIDGHDIYGAVEEAGRIGVPGIVPRNDGASEARARALHAALSSMFSWLQRHRWVDVNPCATVHRPPPPRARERVLTPAEIRWFWQACEASDQPLDPKAPRPYHAALRLLLLTGARLNEVAGMRRDELREDGTWHIPGSRTKNRRPTTVPLPALAHEIIASLPGETALVFTTTGNTPVSGWSKIKGRVDKAMLKAASKGRDDVTIPPWRLHDLRRTAATGMAEIGIAPHIVEAALNHVSGANAGVAGTYNRAAYAEEKRAALERWASHLEGIVSGRPANVVSLSRKRQK
jgi:integrase